MLKAEERAKEARARAEKASPGPWVQDGELGCDTVRAPNMRLTADDDPGICYTEGYDFGEDDEGNYLPCQDAVFIAAARTDVPALCDDVEAALNLARRLAIELFGPWPPGRSRLRRDQARTALRAEALETGLLEERP